MVAVAVAVAVFVAVAVAVAVFEAVAVAVGVAVFVAVAVAVAVLVAVAVAVFVAVGVAVFVAVAVRVAVAVAVRVAVAVALAVAVAVAVGVAAMIKGWSYSSARLLSVSAIYRLPVTSSATPDGSHRLSAVPLNPSKSQVSVLKLLPCPNTKLAAMLLASGELNSSTRLLPWSAT